MIRRWSHIETLSCANLNLKFSQSAFEHRFDILKFFKMVSFRRFKYGITKFKRRKLFSKKRRGQWIFYNQIMKNWIKDYRIHKFVARTQYVDNIMPISLHVYNFFSIKKKNPLNIEFFPTFFLNSFTKKLYFRYLNKFCFIKTDTNSAFIFLKNFKNNNFVNLYTTSDTELFFSNNVIPLLFCYESSYFFFSNYEIKNHVNSTTHNLNIFLFFKFLLYKNHIFIYKIFIFFFIKLFDNVK